MTIPLDFWIKILLPVVQMKDNVKRKKHILLVSIFPTVDQQLENEKDHLCIPALP